MCGWVLGFLFVLHIFFWWESGGGGNGEGGFIKKITF